MIWRDLPPPAAAGKASETAAVVLRVSPASGRFKQRLILLARPLVAGGGGGLAWWRAGTAVAVALGDAGDGCFLRVAAAPDGVVTGWALKPGTGQSASKPAAMARLIVPGFLVLPPAGLPPTTAPYDVSAGCLIVTLPPGIRWPASAKSPGSSAAPPAEPAAAPRGQPFRGVTATTGLGNGTGRATRSIPA